MGLVLHSAFVGRKSKTCTITISLQEAIRFCAGIYETDLTFYDDRLDPMPVHPMLVPALTWRISSNFEEYWETRDFPIEALLNQVHYIEEIQWYQPLYVGQKLHIQGELKAIVPHLAGTLMHIEYKATDNQDKLVFIEGSTVLLRGVPCTDKGRGKEVFQPKVKGANPSGEWTHSIDIEIHPYDAYIYDACSEIRFPIHTSYRIAEQVGLPGPIYQGTAILGRVVQVVRSLNSIRNRYEVEYVYTRFSSFITEGNTLTLNLYNINNTENNGKSFLFGVINQNKDFVLKNGIIHLRKQKF